MDWCRAIDARIRLRHPKGVPIPGVSMGTASQVDEIDPSATLVVAGPTVAAAYVETAVVQGDMDVALLRSDMQSRYLERISARSSLPHALLTRHKILRSRGSVDQARETLEEARQSAESMGASYALWMILDGLSRIAAEQGDTQSSSDLRLRARDIVVDIAADVEDEAYRAAVLRLPEIERILTEQPPGDI